MTDKKRVVQAVVKFTVVMPIELSDDEFDKLQRGVFSIEDFVDDAEALKLCATMDGNVDYDWDYYDEPARATGTNELPTGDEPA
jgi:hypothetical protein